MDERRVWLQSSETRRQRKDSVEREKQRKSRIQFSEQSGSRRWDASEHPGGVDLGVPYAAQNNGTDERIHLVLDVTVDSGIQDCLKPAAGTV